MSQAACVKKAERGVPPFVLLAVTIEDRIDDPIHAVDIHEANHRSRPAGNLDKATLHHVGGLQAAPKMLGKTVEAKQFRLIAFPPLQPGRIQIPPASPKGPEYRSRRLTVLRPVDRLRVNFHGVINRSSSRAAYGSRIIASVVSMN
jgi:hypothetical protein